jgi:hypothetical protein
VDQKNGSAVGRRRPIKIGTQRAAAALADSYGLDRYPV